MFRVDYFRFDLVFIKKITKPKPVQTDRFRFGFLGKNLLKPVWLGFFGFGSVFSVLALFFPGLARVFSWFGFGLVFSVSGL
jgi:hypothetical protein